MPITSQQANTGTATATTSISVTLGTATVAGNTLVLRVGCSGSINLPSGFTRDSPAATGEGIYRKTAVDGESSWTVSAGSAQDWTWHAEEYAGIDTDFPVDAVPVSAGTGSSTGTTPASTTYDGIALAMHRTSVAGGTPATHSGQTNGFTEQAEVSVVGASNSLTISASQHAVQSLGTWESTVTPSAGTAPGLIVVYTAQGAKKAADMVVHAGFEWGTASGIATVAGQSPFDAVTGSPAIVSTSPRTGAWCLELSASAAAENLTWTTGFALGSGTNFGVLRAGVYFPTSLPGGDVEVCSLETGLPTVAVVRYRTSGTKLTLQVGSGTEVNGPVVVAGQWYGIDLRLDCHAATFTADWQVDGAAQTQASLGGQTATNVAVVRLGWATAATATVRYDDVAVSKIAGHYPLGDVQVRKLGPDQAATPTISGTAGNFNQFTNNGTMAAFAGDTAKTYIDEVPPTVGASADGFAQVTAASADYVEVPMETYQAVPDGAPRSVRMYACGWAASGTAATLGFRVYNGTTETTLFAAANPTFDNAATQWVCKSRTTTGAKIAWDQTQLDALAYRVGFSTDATPDIGVNALLAEVAVQMATVQPLFGDLASQQLDTGTDGILAVDVTPTAGYDATLHYSEAGSPTDVAAPGGTTTTKVIDAPDPAAVDYVAVYPPAEDTPDA